jgi:hypothetical protein
VSLLDVRKLVIQVEETRRELDQPVDPPTQKVVAAAVISNPYAGLSTSSGSAEAWRSNSSTACTTCART